MSEMNPKDGMTSRQRSDMFFGFMAAVATPLRLCCTSPKSLGWREAQNPSNFIGLVLMAVWGAVTHSEALACILAPVASFITLLHMSVSPRDNSQHSHGVGDSLLLSAVKTRSWSRYLESAIAMAAGALLLDEDHGLATWLIAAGAAHLYVFNTLNRREVHIHADLNDAMHDARNRSGTTDRPPLF